MSGGQHGLLARRHRVRLTTLALAFNVRLRLGARLWLSSTCSRSLDDSSRFDRLAEHQRIGIRLGNGVLAVKAQRLLVYKHVKGVLLFGLHAIVKALGLLLEQIVH